MPQRPRVYRSICCRAEKDMHRCNEMTCRKSLLASGHQRSTFIVKVGSAAHLHISVIPYGPCPGTCELVRNQEVRYYASHPYLFSCVLLQGLACAPTLFGTLSGQAKLCCEWSKMATRHCCDESPLPVFSSAPYTRARGLLLSAF